MGFFSKIKDKAGEYAKKVFGGLLDRSTAIPRVLRAVLVGGALWYTGDLAGATNEIATLLGGAGGLAGLLGAGEMNK